MTTEHIQFLSPKILRVAELTRECLPLVEEMEAYALRHGLPDDEIVALSGTIAPDVLELLDRMP